MVAVRSTLEAMEARFAGAVCPEDVFGILGGTASEQDAALKAQYRDLVRACHPDLAAAGDAALATRVFQELTRWEAIARKKIEAGTYGDGEPYRAPATPAAYTPTELTVRGKSLRLTGLLGEGVFASVHAAEYAGETTQAAFTKIARDPQDNDLLEQEFRVLRAFQRPDADPQAERDFFGKQRVYVPSTLTSFSVRDEAGARHQANVLAVPQGQCFTAEALRREKSVGGVEPKHVWWIFRRLLLTAWMAHLRGYVHGGITPDHLLIYPEAHGIVLLDWTCAAKIGEEPVPAINPAYEQGYYAPEVLRKELAMPSSDLFAAAATAVFLLGGDPVKKQVPNIVAPPIREALLDCLNPVARRRPQDAERFHHDFGKLLGPRAYAELIVS